MDPKFVLLLLLSTPIVCFSDAAYKEELQTLHSSYKKLVKVETSTPGFVTIPSATPITVTPTPVFNPITAGPTTPTTNPAAPVTTPSTNYPGQRWCVAKSGVAQKSLQAALDYACGIGGADCSAIQQGANCFNPNTLQNHASYAFNTYFQKNPVPTSCDFGATAVITSVNPSSGSCVFATSSSSKAPATTAPPTPTATTAPPPVTLSPTTTSPTPTTVLPPPALPTTTTPTPTTVLPPPALPTTTTPTPTTMLPPPALPTTTTPIPTSGTLPSILNASNPDQGSFPIGFGASSPTAMLSVSCSLRPLFGFIVMVASGTFTLDILG